MNKIQTWARHSKHTGSLVNQDETKAGRNAISPWWKHSPAHLDEGAASNSP